MDTVTDGSEDSAYIFYTQLAGTLTRQLTIGGTLGTRISVGDGTGDPSLFDVAASNASFTWLGDTDTGLSYSQANEFGLMAGGEFRFFVTDSGDGADHISATIRNVDRGTPIDGDVLSFSWQMEDTGGFEEQGSIDLQLDDVTDGTEDSHWEFVAQAAGTMAVALEVGPDETSFPNSAEGGTGTLNIKSTHETHTLAAASTSTTSTIDVPSGAIVLGASFNVDTAVVDSAGDDTWTGALDGGSSTNLAAAGTAAAQNTKVDTMIAPEKMSAETNVIFTAQGGNFSAGVIEVVVYYMDLTGLANV